ncbi:RIP metalloprotease RseP [Caldichromatium japonicum]|uniref:Zinc metalloprotease n=1 Tax=Caldichromatium japonicum TaxID=2699430 RepID=A0A6G7VBF3_9GAMM|nr:RIP metalloprotease RseP [Caldichromatium japonicum]QIK37304.1 RIP metalloprotease RseP [Caldichromatium japonicum]
MNTLWTLAAFLLTLAILITVHEFGHFWVAQRLAVKVLRFSIGFGRPLWSRRLGRDQTEYVIALIPFGGYVKMLDEREAEDPIPESELPRAFNRQALWKRSAIVIAGPLFNLLFAVFAYWLVFMMGETGLKPIIGEVAPDSIAARAGFEAGDEFLAISARPTRTWEEVIQALTVSALTREDLKVQVRDRSQTLRDRLLLREDLKGLDESADIFAELGIKPYRLLIPAVIGEIVPGEPAERAGLQVGDRILAVDGRPINAWQDLVEEVRRRPDMRLVLTIERPGVGSQTLELITQTAERDGQRIGRIGAGVEPRPDLLDAYRVRIEHGPVESLGLALSKTYETSALLLKVLGRMLIGEGSLKHLSGPIGIAETAGRTAAYGLDAFIKFLAVISISLGVLNLLPIPVLDGGHLLFNLIEWIRGSPVSEEAMLRSQQIGVLLLATLMTFAFYVDLARLLG